MNFLDTLRLEYLSLVLASSIFLNLEYCTSYFFFVCYDPFNSQVNLVPICPFSTFSSDNSHRLFWPKHILVCMCFRNCTVGNLLSVVFCGLMQIWEIGKEGCLNLVSFYTICSIPCRLHSSFP
jgi:hypothetical protein